MQEKNTSRADEDIGSEHELKIRLTVYERHNKHWGLVREDDSMFWDISTEFYLIIAGCQIRMLQHLGSAEVPSLDELMAAS